LNCDFERDFCHWIIKAETEFEWVARTGNEILELEINGPSEVIISTLFVLLITIN
jgi:hypothetical protein